MHVVGLNVGRNGPDFKVEEQSQTQTARGELCFSGDAGRFRVGSQRCSYNFKEPSSNCAFSSQDAMVL